VSEELANAFATGECLLRHRGLSFRRRRGGPSEVRMRSPSGLNFDPFRGPEVRLGNQNVPNPFFKPPKRKTTRGAQGRTRSSEPSRHGLQKPEIAYLPTARDGKRHPLAHRLFVLPTQYGLTIIEIRGGSPSLSTLFCVFRASGDPFARLLQRLTGLAPRSPSSLPA